MDGSIIAPHRWTRMQDPRLARSEELAAREATGRRFQAQRTPDREVLAATLRDALSRFAAAWRAARKRRHALRALKRIDRRLLADMGMDRARLREVIDAMVAQREDAESATPRRPEAATAAWIGPRATAS